MSRQTVKVARYHTIEYINTAANGKQTRRAARSRIVGYYDARTNLTKYHRFDTGGSGNLPAVPSADH